MSGRIALATTARLGAQLRRDRRTLVLVFVVPPGLLALLRYVLDEQPASFERVGAPLVGLFPLIVMFLITSIAMLRERTTGTLERLMSLPLGKPDLLAGYALAFAVLAAAEATVTAALAFGVLDVDVAGSVWGVIALAVANAVLGMALGLLVSALATSEFQAVQFMPAFVVPQIFLAGLFVPRERMPDVLQAVADLLPFTYAYDALAKVAANDIDDRLWLDVAVVAGCVVLALALAAMTLRRRTP